MIPTAPRTISAIDRRPGPRQPYVATFPIVVFIKAEDPPTLKPNITGSSIPNTIAAMKVITPYFRTTMGLLDIVVQLIICFN